MRGNHIGVDVGGTTRVANGGAGVNVSASMTNTIGGVDPSYGNLISGNIGNGVIIEQGSTLTRVRFNQIGVDIDGGQGRNGRNGVAVSSSDDVRVTDNTIANNVRDGVVAVGTTTQLRIRRNAIYSNGQMGIDLGDDGVTGNDPFDQDGGVNGLQNFPDAIDVDAGTGEISGFFSGFQGLTYTVDFYRSDACDDVALNDAFYGEGAEHLGETEETTSGLGQGSFDLVVGGFAAGDFITITLTDPTGSTSEFSQCVQAGVPTAVGVHTQQATGTTMPLVAVGLLLLVGLTGWVRPRFECDPSLKYNARS